MSDSPLEPAPLPPHATEPVSLTERPRGHIDVRRLTITILLHVVLLVVAMKIVVAVIKPTSKQNELVFSPVGSGGGSSGPTKASFPAQKRLRDTSALPRLTTKAATASSLQLPEIPRFSDPFAGPSLSAGGMPAGGGGFGGGFGSGIGPGSGPGMGLAGGRGYVASFFGMSGGREVGLQGTLYDLKQDRDRRPRNFVNTEATYAQAINEAARRRFNYSSLRHYYQASQRLTFTYLAVPRLRAEEGPKAFNAEEEVLPTAWFVHYSGRITPPSMGPWRFVGMFDDALVVYINGKPVLDGSWYPLVALGNDNPDPEIRQELTHGPYLVEGSRRPYAGKWVRLEKDARIDIIVGERPGGLVGGVLLIEKQGEKYKTHPDGAPILPLFTTKVLTNEDKKRIREFEESQFPFPVAEISKTPIFLVKPLD